MTKIPATIIDLLDATASGRSPSLDDLEATIAEVTRGGGPVGRPHDVAAIRKALTEAVTDVGRYASVGSTGLARQSARDHYFRIEQALGATTGTTGDNTDVTTLDDMRAVVDSIPRY